MLYILKYYSGQREYGINIFCRFALGIKTFRNIGKSFFVLIFKR